MLLSPVCASDTLTCAGPDDTPAAKTLDPARVTTRLEKAGMYCVGVNVPTTVDLSALVSVTEKTTDCECDENAKNRVAKVTKARFRRHMCKPSIC